VNTDRARTGFPLGAAVTREQLSGELHGVLHRLRSREPVSWLPALGGWLVTSRDLALRVLRDSSTFTVDDPRFSTARVVGPSMLSLDGAAHKRHRDPFADAFRLANVQATLDAFVTEQAGRLVAGLSGQGRAELRRSLAGPLAVAVVGQLLGLGETAPEQILNWYDAIVAAVTELTGAPAGGAASGSAAAGADAFGLLAARLKAVITTAGGSSLLAAAAREGASGEPADIERSTGSGPGSSGGLSTSAAVSNAAVLMFGGIETTEGMICNAVLHLLSEPAQLAEVMADPGLAVNAVEESLRLEPAAAVVDRYATSGARLGDATIRSGDLVTVSLAGANRDPAFFTDPDRFDLRRGNARQHLAFAHGPHFCIGAHLARMEAVAAVQALLALPGLRLDPRRLTAARGLVFRKPHGLHVLWNA
jgi:cytochrome P450